MNMSRIKQNFVWEEIVVFCAPSDCHILISQREVMILKAFSSCYKFRQCVTLDFGLWCIYYYIRIWVFIFATNLLSILQDLNRFAYHCLLINFAHNDSCPKNQLIFGCIEDGRKTIIEVHMFLI